MKNWYELKLTVADEMEEALQAFAEEKALAFYVKTWVDEKRTELRVFVKRQSQAEAIKTELAAFLSHAKEWGLKLGKPVWRISHTDEKAWFKYSLQEFKPIKISRHIVIRPTWHEYLPRPWEKVVVVDPQMAFGTGHHFTTRFCLQMLDRYSAHNQTVLDVGCGSGILAIAAAKLGAKKVLGIDHDPLAIKTAKTNAKQNKAKVQFKSVDLTTFKTDTADLVFANITSPVLIQNQKRLFSFVKPKGVLITTGILREEKQTFLHQFASPHFKIIDQKHSRLWCGFVYQRC